MTGGLRILVSGMLAGVPGQGGATWAVLQYVLGLRSLGHDVMFVEQVDAPADVPLSQRIPSAATSWSATACIPALSMACGLAMRPGPRV